jgi:hypothetical protein
METQGLRTVSGRVSLEKELRSLLAAMPIVMLVTAIRAAAQRSGRSRRAGAVGTVRSA